jgi:hypothetical protein
VCFSCLRFISDCLMYYQNQRLELLSLEVNSGTSGPAVGGRASGVCQGSRVGSTAEGNSSGLWFGKKEPCSNKKQELKWAKGKNVSTVDIKKIQQLSRSLCLNAFASHCSRCAPALHFCSRYEHSSNTLCENEKNHFLHASSPATQSSEKNPLVLVLGNIPLLRLPPHKRDRWPKSPQTHNV